MIKVINILKHISLFGYGLFMGIGIVEIILGYYSSGTYALLLSLGYYAIYRWFKYLEV